MKTLNTTTTTTTTDSIEDYDSEEEVDNVPVRAVLVPAPVVAGQPFTLEVDMSEEVAAPSSLPLTMVCNMRSANNKVKNIKQTLNTRVNRGGTINGI